MAWGISPRKIVVIPLGDYNADHYLTLLYNAFNNLGWRIGYFNRDGIIGYTPISWASYAEEVSVRIVNNHAIIKSECVGYQGLFTDYGKNEKNLELLINGEIAYVEYHLQNNLQETTQELIDGIPDNQFISLNDPPMGYKEKLRTFLAAFTPKQNYLITPLLVLTNIAVFIVTMLIMVVMFIVIFITAAKHHTDPDSLSQSVENVYLSLGFSSRAQVLNGQVWRLVTNNFLHFSFTHLAFNMIALIYIGSLLESKLGKWNYLLIYLLTGICASITSTIWNIEGISGGASGAIFGLFGVLLALLSTNFYERSARRALLISTAIFVGLSIIPIGRGIDHAAHFGGVIAGYIFGWIAFLGLKYQRQNLSIACVVAITILFTIICIRFEPAYQLKEMERLTTETEKLSNSLSRDFYGGYGLSYDERLAVFNNKVIPEINKLGSVAQKFDHLILPKKQKQIANVKSKLIAQQCKLFTLLYIEFREQEKVKYRKQINLTTDTINALRIEWGKLDDGN